MPDDRTTRNGPRSFTPSPAAAVPRRPASSQTSLTASWTPGPRPAGSTSPSSRRARQHRGHGAGAPAIGQLCQGHAIENIATTTLTTPECRSEHRSSSGLIVSTGTGATGWRASIALERGGRVLAAPTDPALAWFVREAWPSPATGASLTEGVLEAGEPLRLTVASDQLVMFGDGMEQDRLTSSWGQEISVELGGRPLRLA